jgi:hypothetical protein
MARLALDAGIAANAAPDDPVFLLSRPLAA